MKKLTAGIFTALLGLVTVNAANAAIPSTTYVDNQITTAQEAAEDYADAQDAALKTAIETAYEAADTALDGKITDNANAISAVDTFVAPDVAMTVGNANPTTVTAAINALDARITEKTSGIASEGTVNELTEAVEGLKTTVSGHTTDISGLEGRVATAEGEIDTLQGNVQTLTNADATNLQAAKDYADGLATNYDAAGSAAAAETRAKTYAESEADAAQSAAETYAKNYADGLNTAATAAIEANTASIESNDSDIAGLKDKDTELAGLISGNATEIAKKADATATTQALETKAAKYGYTASQVVVTDGTGTITTAAQIPNTQVSGLGDLATKSTIADADVAANAEIAQSKIAGLEAALANTTPKVTARGEAGTYVLTAIVSDSGVTSYQWEQIERPTTGGEG